MRTAQSKIAIAAVALIVRLIAIWRFGPSAIRFGDAPDYLSAAANLCSTGAYPASSSMPFFRAPGLPFFIAAVTACNTNAVWAVKIALAMAGTVAVLLIFLLAEELFHDSPVALIAASAAALYPFFVAQSCDVQTEGLFMLLLLAAVSLTVRAARSDHLISIFLAGLVAGAAALTRPVGLLVAGLLPLQLLLTGRRKPILQLLCFAAGLALCLGPWIVRNELKFHETILVNDAGGYNFWRGTSPQMEAINRITDRAAFEEASLQFETVTVPALALGIAKSAATPGGRSRGWYKLAAANFREAPAAFTGRLLRNAWIYWRPWLNPVTSSRTVVIVSGLVVTSLYLLGAFGWVLLWRMNSRLALWFALSALTFWILQIPFQVVSRFRIPITDPFLIIFAAAAVRRAISAEPNTDYRSSPAAPAVWSPGASE